MCALSLPAQLRKVPRPLPAPAYQLPTSHGAIAEAMLGHLNHPWPLGQCPTATRARPGLVVGCMLIERALPELGEGSLEPADGNLVLDACNLVILVVLLVAPVVEASVLGIMLRRAALDARCCAGRLCGR